MSDIIPPEVVEEFVDDFDEEKDDPLELSNNVETLISRCKEANIQIEESIYSFNGTKYYNLSFPCGRENRIVTLSTLKRIKRLLDIPFEKYIFLGNYAAICSYSDGIIEASIRQVSSRLPSSFINKTINEFNFIQSEDGITISIGLPSKDLEALVSRFGFGIKIEGLKISKHDQSLKILEKISNSIFFQIDKATNIAFNLSRQRSPLKRIREHLRNDGLPIIEFPRYEYDEAPMSLYWYARSATGMPLLQFLAYYQSIEYYFPTYSEAESRRMIINILKDPNFRPDRDVDISRILTSIRPGGRIGFGDERSQLRATLQECLNPVSLRSFLEESVDMKDFFSSKTKGLTDVKIPINNVTADLRNDIADRLYDIRCKIVHTKSNGSEDVEILLPFSKEAEELSYDIDLIQYISRQVLIAASSSMQS